MYAAGVGSGASAVRSPVRSTMAETSATAQLREAELAALDQVGYLQYDHTTHERTISKHPCSPRDCGPLWLGPLADKVFLSTMKIPDTLQERDRCVKYMDLWKEELDVPYFYENNELSSVAKLSPPKRETLIERMKQMGAASRTHFSPTGFKSDRSFAEILAAYQEIGIPETKT